MGSGRLRTRVPAGPWRPDRPRTTNPKGLTLAKNAVPIAGGYASQPSLEAVSGYTALAERARGSIAVLDTAGNPINFVGTETKLYRLGSNGTEDVTRASGAYNCADDARWEFQLFGTTLVAANPSDHTQYIDILTGTQFADLRGDAAGAPDGSQGEAPRFRHLGIVGNFLVGGNAYDPSFELVPNSVWWAANRNPFNWPAPGSDDAVAAQSDRQPLEGNGGWVQRIIGGAEVGMVFQERSIWRMDERGGDIVFEFTRVEPNRGLLAPGLAVAVGRLVFYCAEDGWYVTDYTTSQPIGKERWDRFFLADLDEEYLDRCSMAFDPDAQRWYALYPGAGNVGGTPNRYLCYDWSLQRATHGEIDAELLTQVLNPVATLDTGSDPDDLDAPGEPSLDYRLSKPGAAVLGAWGTDDALAAFTGAALEATFRTDYLDLDPGHWTYFSSVRPLTTGCIPYVRSASLERLVKQDDVEFGLEERVDEEGGDALLRSNGRYHQIEVRIPAGGFNDFVGLDIEDAVRAGTR